MSGILASITNDSFAPSEPVAKFTVDEALAHGDALASVAGFWAESAECKALQTQLETTNDSLTLQEDVIGSLLQTPDTVTRGSVILAQASMVSLQRSFLGGETPDYLVSNDSTMVPAVGMELTNDGIKDVLKQTGKAAGLLVKRVLNAMKKLMVKVLVAVNGSAKQATALLKKVTASKVKKASSKYYTEKEAKGMARTTAVATAFYEMGGDSLTVDNTLAEVSDAVESMVKAVNAEGDDAAIKTAFDASLTKLKTMATSHDKIDNLPTDSEFDLFIPLFAQGSNIKFIRVVTGEAESGDEVTPGEALRKVRIGTTTVKAYDESDQDLTKMAIMSHTDLVSTLSDIEKDAKAIGKFADAKEKTGTKFEKAIKDATGSKESQKKLINRLRGNLANSASAVVTGVLLDSVLAYMSGIKTDLRESKTAFSYYNESSI